MQILNCTLTQDIRTAIRRHRTSTHSRFKTRVDAPSKVDLSSQPVFHGVSTKQSDHAGDHECRGRHSAEEGTERMTEQQQQATAASLATEREQRSSRMRPKLDRSQAVHGTVVTREVTTEAREKRNEPRIAPASRVAPDLRLAPEPLVEIPRHLPIDRELPAGHLSCPNPIPGTSRHATLARQTIGVAICEQRQCGGYHKCGGCDNRSQPQWQGSELAPVDNGPSAAARDRRAQRS